MSSASSPFHSIVLQEINDLDTLGDPTLRLQLLLQYAHLTLGLPEIQLSPSSFAVYSDLIKNNVLPTSPQGFKVSHLSQELVDHIIDHLCLDSHSLASCALVARNWVPSSRRHLYSKVNLHKGLLFYNSSKNIPRLESLLDLLDAPTSTIAPHIRHVTLFFSFLHHHYFSSLVVEVMARLPALRSISFLSHPTDMVGIRLNWPEYEENFCHIICSVPLLERLEVVWATSTFRCSTSRAFPLHLKHLVVQNMKTAMIQWWLANETRPQIHTVEFQSIYPEETPLIGTFLKALGPSLKHLRLPFKGPRIETEDSFCANVNLALNTYLRSLEIDDISFEPKLVGRVYFDWLFALLSQIKSEHIRHMKIWMYVGEGVLDLFDWGRLDDILSNAPFGRLETLSFGAYVLDRSYCVFDAVAERLPKFRRRGQINLDRFESCDYSVLQV